MPLNRKPADITREIAKLEQELAGADLNDRARAALQKNLELKRRLLASYSEVGGTMKALETELDSMASLLEVLHQNSISLRDPQAISEELDTIVRQSEDSERVVREMEALLRTDAGAWGADDLTEGTPLKQQNRVPPLPPRQKVKGR
jgi:signal transduction histidine kinase